MLTYRPPYDEIWPQTDSQSPLDFSHWPVYLIRYRAQPLYLAKQHWTNRFDEERESTIGIFCGIWVGPTLLKKKQFAYNIHAKSLQKLPGYKLTPKIFANDFRILVGSQVSQWPSIRLDYGPSTLLQGTETCELDSFAEKVEERLLGFVDICGHLDDLLEHAEN